MSEIRIGTRTTPLALAQAELVAHALRGQGLVPRLVPMTTQGDRTLGGSLATAKGLFTADLSTALREGRVDVVVHSLKDLPVGYEPGLRIAAIPRRARAHDLLLRRAAAGTPPAGAIGLLVLLEQPEAEAMRSVVDPAAALGTLPAGAVLGTSSPRRQCGALALRPDLVCCAVRGSVGRRLEWLQSGAIEALVLAEAGLQRLLGDAAARGLMSGLCACRLDLKRWPCAPGQGALAVQLLRGGPWDDHPALAALDDPASRAAAEAERRLLASLGGGCGRPFGAFCDGKSLYAAVGSDDWQLAAARGLAPLVLTHTLDLAEAHLDETVETVAKELLHASGARSAPETGVLVLDLELDAGLHPESQPPELVVTAGAESAARLTRLVRGMRIAALPVSRTIPAHGGWPSDQIELPAHRRDWPWVLVSSPAAARVLVEHASSETIWTTLPWCALGEGTARTLLGAGFPPNLVAMAQDAAGFAAFLLARFEPGRRFFVPQSSRASDRLGRALRDGGMEVVAFSAYTTEPRTDLRWGWPAPPAAVLYTAPSAALAWEGAGLEWPALALALGPATAAALERRGRGGSSLRLRVATQPTAEAVRELLEPA